jgi:hypothetical protein
MKECLEAGARVDNPVKPRSHGASKSTPGKFGENVDASRITSKNERSAPIAKLLRTNALERCAERGQRIINRLRIPISGAGFYEKVKIFRKARLPVKDDRKRQQSSI